MRQDRSWWWPKQQALLTRLNISVQVIWVKYFPPWPEIPFKICLCYRTYSTTTMQVLTPLSVLPGVFRLSQLCSLWSSVVSPRPVTGVGGSWTPPDTHRRGQPVHMLWVWHGLASTGALLVAWSFILEVKSSEERRVIKAKSTHLGRTTTFTWNNHFASPCKPVVCKTGLASPPCLHST